MSHYETSLNDKTFAEAKAILEATGHVSVRAPVNNKSIQEAAQALLTLFFNDTQNLWVGDSADNSSIQDDKDFPTDDPAFKRAHVRAIKAMYFLKV